MIARSIQNNVHEAYDTVNNRLVVIKSCFDDDEFNQYVEINRVKKIVVIPELYDHWIIGSQHVIVLELFSGDTLASIIDDWTNVSRIKKSRCWHGRFSDQC